MTLLFDQTSRLPQIFIDPTFNKQIEQNYILQRIYYRPSGYYHIPDKLWAKARAEGYDIDISDVTEWLHKQAVWQIHSPAPKYIPQVSFNKITRPNMYHQADILYMPHDTVGRKLYKYCLNIVDVASRYKASVPLEDRSSARVAKAFKKIYSKADCLLIWPKVLQVDGGSEFKDEVIRLMEEKGVRIRVGTTHKNQAIVERYNRTLAERLFKIQDAKELLTEGVNTAWVENLPDIVNELNNSNTRLLGMPPVEAIQKDQVYALPSKIRKDRLVGINEIRLPAGSSVRYLLDSSDYRGRRRATDPIWSTKIFTIESSTVIDGQPVMYQLTDGPKKYFIREQLLIIPLNTMLPPASLLGLP
jgi:Integrase core domain